MSFRWPCFALVLPLLTGLAVPAAFGQLPPSPDAPPVSNFPNTSTDQEANPSETLKVNVNLVSLYFTVRDKHNGLVANLIKDDCNIFEDKQPQTVKNFTAETDLPLTLGILLDTSGSQQNVLQMEQQAADNFLKQVLRKKDEAFLVTFDVNVNLEQDFTNSPSLLARAIDHTEINTAGGNGAAGVPGIGTGPVPVHGTPKGTLLYDAVDLASNDKLRSETGRKALILLTDGEDQGSETKPGKAIEAAQKSNAIVYVLLIADRGAYFNYGGFYTGDAQMRKLAEDTGGRVINVGNNGKKMEDAFAQIEEELRTQYLASYTPTNKALDGSYRKVDIFCKGDGLKVQSRKGYYAVGNTEDDAQ
ncbi:VWA domain-containing protein [Paracidobacterium acidisoli]|uniref:VWA domain-containing protein n=1 Tax=Paracidobacterium acidisoli TaxID=2303751 RepID=A0A372IIS1_9BACT|nr:VWA domain-containing protein [Paracidobacterium acidisoli]MBT9333304.1 VWA domain-containing protein [Paracidobacterium acidisoli]